MEDKAWEGSVKESTWCGTRKGEGHYGISWDLSKTGKDLGKDARTSVTQEGYKGANRGIGFWHFHLKLGLLPSKGGGPSDSVCASGTGCTELQLGADRVRQRQEERASLTAWKREGYKLDIQDIRTAK